MKWEDGCGIAEPYEHVEPNRNNQPCHDRQRDDNGTRFEWLLRCAGITVAAFTRMLSVLNLSIFRFICTFRAVDCELSAVGFFCL